MVSYTDGPNYEESLIHAKDFIRLSKLAYEAKMDLFGERIGVEVVAERLFEFESALRETSILYPDTLNGRAAYARALAEVFGLYECAGKFLHVRQHAEKANAMGLTGRFGIAFIKADDECVRGNICNDSIHAAPFYIDNLTDKISDFAPEQVRVYLKEQKELDWSGAYKQYDCMC